MAGILVQRPDVLVQATGQLNGARRRHGINRFGLIFAFNYKKWPDQIIST